MDDTNTVNPEENAETLEKKEKNRVKRFIGSFNHSLDSKGRLVIPPMTSNQLRFIRLKNGKKEMKHMKDWAS